MTKSRDSVLQYDHSKIRGPRNDRRKKGPPHSKRTFRDILRFPGGGAPVLMRIDVTSLETGASFIRYLEGLRFEREAGTQGEVRWGEVRWRGIACLFFVPVATASGQPSFLQDRNRPLIKRDPLPLRFDESLRALFKPRSQGCLRLGKTSRQPALKGDQSYRNPTKDSREMGVLAFNPTRHQ